MIDYGRRIGLHEKPAYGTVIVDPFHPLSQGLIGYWLMNEGGGNIAYDISRHGNHGTLTNGPTWGGSKFGGGLGFDGSDDYADCGNDASLNPAGAVTVGARVCSSTSTDNRKIVDKSSWVDKDGYVLYMENGIWRGIVFNGGDAFFVDGSSITTNNWYYLTLTYDPTTKDVKLYENADLKDTNTLTGERTNTGLNLKIGIEATGSDYTFNGTIDEVRIYNRALAAWEVKQLYRNPFCNLMRVPIRRYSVEAQGGLTILDFERAGMRGVMRGIMRGVA